jgi:DNA-binding SARP family transcriptional activator
MNSGARDFSPLGPLIRDFRQAAGLTQHELAARATLSVGSVRDLEQGRTRRPQQSSLAALVAALGLNSTQTGDLERAAAGRGLWLQVLGPLAAWRDGTAVGLSGRAQRVVLGLLALSPGSLLHRSAFIDILWPGNPPASAVNLVQVHVSRLRRVLMLGSGTLPDRSDCLSSAGTSYRLQVGSGQLDLLRFDQLIVDARTAHADGDDAAACYEYEQALGLWRGDPLADVELLCEHPAVKGLSRRRAEAVIEYAQVGSAVGWHKRVLPALRELAWREPLNEQAHAQLMTALAGCGQQAEALAVYRDLRRRLDDELAMRPGQELVNAHQLVLGQNIVPASATITANVATAAGPAMIGGNRGGQPVPLQLPLAAPFFTGRATELSALRQLLDAETVAIAVVSGAPGVGKTALAVHWAHQVAGQFPDGQLYVDLRGFDPSADPIRPAVAVRGFLAALGVPVGEMPSSPEARQSLYRSLLARRRTLLVLDNAWDERQVRPLLPACPGSLVLITSRNQLAGLAAAEGACLFRLDVLSDAEARQMFGARLGKRADAEPEAADQIVSMCGRLPLVLAIAAARAATYPHLPLADLAAMPGNAHDLLDIFDTGDPLASVRTVFSWSLRHIGPEAARMFRLLGLHRGPDCTVPGAASLAGITQPAARQALHELAAASLVTERSPGRYALHDLIRAYAAEQAEAGARAAD